MISRNYVAVAVAACLLSISACADREGDAKRLGFDSAKEMDDIRAAGYSTKAKFVEMSKLADARKARSASPPAQQGSATAAVPALPAHNLDAATTQPKVAAEEGSKASTNAIAASSSTQLPTTQSNAPQLVAQAIDVAKCVDMSACVGLMLVAAKSENLSGAMDVARKIDGFPKATRGDRKTARQLNQNGLA